MQALLPSSVLSLYFSKQSIGISCFYKQQPRIQCASIQFYIYSTAESITRLVYDKNPSFILTNHDRHPFLFPFLSTIKVIKVDERGLEDDIIQNNLSLLKLNLEKTNIQNKNAYIKMMREHSESIGLMNEKYRALGMLIYYLLNCNQIGTTSKLFLNQIKYFNDCIFSHMQISNSQLQSLQIIKQQVHPSFIKGKGRSKQGFSILSLYETPMSSIGSKKILRHIFRNPTFNQLLLQSRYHLIYWIKKYCNDYKNLVKTFRSVHNVETILHRFAQSKVEIDDWRKLAKTLQSMIITHKVIEEKIKDSALQSIPQLLDSFFKEIRWEEIAKVLSSVLSILNLEDGSINKGVDPELDELKKTYDNLPHFLTLYARQQNWNDQYRIVFMAQIGYLVRVPHEKQIEKFEKQKWNLQFVKNSGKFYSNQLTSMLDNDFGDIYGQISDRQKKIYFELQNIVSDSYDAIERAYWKICQFQCFVGIAIISNGMCKPKLSSESFILSKSWHLLLAQTAIQNNGFSFNQSQAPKERVYNSEQNLVNTNYSNRVMLITGPNGSGKTVYMKQISIIIFLAHIGLYVPAQFAQIPLVDKIILIQSKKSIYRMQNGFESEMASLSRIIVPNMLTNKSLVLIDELGSAIDRILSKKILITLLKFICDPEQSMIEINRKLSKEGDSFKIPLVIAITHLADLISSSLVEENYQLRYLTMDMQKQETYLYKIKPGIVKKGYGIECAKNFMDESFIRRAHRFWRQIKFRE